MKNVLFALGLAVSLVSPQVARADVTPRVTLRVLHWNIFYDGQGTDGIRDRGRQVTTIAGQQPDVITLNEVTANATVDYAARLERATGLRWHHHHSSVTKGGWGNAILSRHPLLSTSVYKMKVGAARSIAQAVLDVNGARVNIFATHLDSGDKAQNRALQAQELLAFVSGFPGPRIVGGDMNASPDAGEIRPLSAAYEDAWMAAVHGGTARAYAANPPHRYTRTRRGRLDYIFASRDIETQECTVPDVRDLTNKNVKTLLRTADDAGVRPSDHNLVSCVFALAAPAPQDPETPDAPDEDSEATDPDDASDPGDGEVDDPGDGGAGDPVEGGDTDPGDGGGEEDSDPEVEPDPDVDPPPSETCGVDSAPQIPGAPLEPIEPVSNDEVVLRPGVAATLAGNWIVESDCSAAGGALVTDPERNAARTGAVAEPLDYFEITFNADAGKPYRLWIRARAANDNWRSDSVSVQFSGSVDALGAPVYRIGTRERTLVTLEDCVSCGLAGWGWQDNGFGEGVLGPEIYFEATGPQTIRIQRREDGISLDQVVLSAGAWLSTSPGATKNDATILPAR